MKHVAAVLFISACTVLIGLNRSISGRLLRVSESLHRASVAALEWAKRP